MNSILSKKNITLSIFLLINFLFAFKYSSRVSSYSFLISIGIAALYFAIWKYKKKIAFLMSYYKHLNSILIIMFVVISIFAFQKISVLSLNVDRWSVITSFWDNYFKGEYVYFAKSNVGNPPGPMPFYFILALPFYLIGEVGYISLLGLILFYWIIKRNNFSKEIQSIILLLLISSLFFLWEVIARSNIFFNGVLVLLVLIELLKIKEFTIKKSVFIGLLIGLVLSTRNVFATVFIIAFIYLIKNKVIFIKNFIIVGVVSTVTFILTFVPFIWNHIPEFKVMNPFLIQSSALMPFKLTLPFIILAFIFGLFCKSLKDIYYYSSTLLFLTIVGYFIYHIITEGFEFTFFENGADISYFIFCLPFCLFFLIKETQAKN